VSGCAFSEVQRLSSICVPLSVEKLALNCFSSCSGLRTVTFECDSRLSCIEDYAFGWCYVLSSICLPPLLKHLNPFAFAETQLRDISVANGNCSFKVVGHFLMDFRCRVVERSFGKTAEVIVPRTVEALSPGCFATCRTLSRVTFESACQLLSIGNYAFLDCSRFSALCIPSSVQQVRQKCFLGCTALSTITFASNSTLPCLGDFSFSQSEILSICIPASVEKLGDHCFAQCASLSTVTFECGSRLSRIGDSVFSQCVQLSSICIPLSPHSLLSEYRNLLKIISTTGPLVDRTPTVASSPQIAPANRR
jgi:hypothetical protein